MNKPYIDLTDHQGPLYLCDWNGGGVTEIHTPETLRANYAETGLYESDGWGDIAWISWTFADVLSHMDAEPQDRRTFRSSNMTIMRIR